MLLPALIVVGACAGLLLLLTLGERAYLRHHVATRAHDLQVAQAQTSSIGPAPGEKESSSLLTETLAQDIFKDPKPEEPRRWPILAARRGATGSTPRAERQRERP